MDVHTDNDKVKKQNMDAPLGKGKKQKMDVHTDNDKVKKQNMDVHTYNNYVVRHNSKDHFVVNHNKYKTTLKHWLEEEGNKNNWCDDYEKWGAYRPKEEARKIIQGILRAVYELHSHNFIHGRLYHPENYAIQDNKVVIGGDHKENKYIFLMHENCDLKEDLGGPDNTQLGDRRAVSNLIFHRILGDGPNGTFVEQLKYPEDLRNLHDLLQKRDLIPREWKLMVNHPSLWHWKSRFVYFDRVWMYFKQAANLGNSSEFYRMKRKFSNIKPEKDWKKNIPHDSPLIKVYNHNGKNSYGESTEDLIRYIRNVRAHYKEIVQCNQRDYERVQRNQRDFESVQRYALEYHEPQYIELKITKLSEPFLVELYDAMCQMDIEI